MSVVKKSEPQRGLSLRAKILILLTLLPMITLAIFLYLALGIFEKDKVAYVFESTSSVTRSTAHQVASDMTGSLSGSRPIIQEYLLTSQFGNLSKSLLSGDSEIEGVAVYEISKDTRSVNRLALVERNPGAWDNAVNKDTNFFHWILETERQRRIVRSAIGDARVMIFEKVETPSGVLYFCILSHFDALKDSFSAPGSSDVYLSDLSGHVLFSTNGMDSNSLIKKVDFDFFKMLQDQKFSSGTRELKTHDGADWLVSFSKVNFANLVVISMVPRKEALRAVDVLLRKSLVLFLLLISGTVMVSLVASGTLTSALTNLLNATKMVAEGQFEFCVSVNSSDEIGALASSFNIMTAEISRLIGETAEKARMESELATAQTVQETLFPNSEAELHGLKIAGYYEPASECGGDWWHYFKVGDKIYLWIGDATGHGAPAALITSAAKSAATIIERFEEVMPIGAASALTLLNRAIYEVSKGKIMMTFFLACYDSKTRVLKYSNASHEAPFLFKKQNRPLKKKDLVPLNDINNPRLGESRDAIFKETSVSLDPGDRIFFYTDGLTDIQNVEKTPWGERQFLKTLLDVTEGYPPVHESIYRLREALVLHRHRAPLIDDVTFFMVEVPEAVAENSEVLEVQQRESAS